LLRIEPRLWLLHPSLFSFNSQLTRAHRALEAAERAQRERGREREAPVAPRPEQNRQQRGNPISKRKPQILTCRSADTVPNECHRYGASSGKLSRFFERSRRAFSRVAGSARSRTSCSTETEAMMDGEFGAAEKESRSADRCLCLFLFFTRERALCVCFFFSFSPRGARSSGASAIS